MVTFDTRVVLQAGHIQAGMPDPKCIFATRF